MPHLQFETNTALDPTDRRALTEWATERYGEVMETGTGHVAVTVRTVDTLTLGRAPEGDSVAILSADVRAGRSAEQREQYATEAIERLAALGIPAEHCYVVYTEHPGEEFLPDTRRESRPLGRA
jgi:5-carboxymethyl-2-hydroxymuconate isomerase